MITILATILVAGWLMFAGMNGLFSWLKPHAIRGDFLRRFILMSCLIFYFLRLLITVFVFLKRRMVWVEAIVITILMSFVLFSFAKVGGNNHQSIGIIEIIGILLYLLGSYLNTRSEYTRHTWKKKEKNKGRLYTEGLFKYSMHINYFGDVILFAGFAMITHSFTMLIIPLIMASNFAFYIIPSLDKYLEKKYGEEFKEYAGRTKKLIPMIY
jgi:steroid 5-alpha reductase family enzyme